MFIGNWTVVGDIANKLSEGPVGIFKMIIDKVRSKGATQLSNAQLKQSTGNIYKELFVNYKKNDDTRISELNHKFELFKDLITYVKKVECKSIPPRPCTTTEIGELKLFKPDKIENEIKQAINYYKSNGYIQCLNLANKVAEYITKDVVGFLKDNIIID